MQVMSNDSEQPLNNILNISTKYLDFTLLTNDLCSAICLVYYVHCYNTNSVGQQSNPTETRNSIV